MEDVDTVVWEPNEVVQLSKMVEELCRGVRDFSVDCVVKKESYMIPAPTQPCDQSSAGWVEGRWVTLRASLCRAPIQPADI